MSNDQPLLALAILSRGRLPSLRRTVNSAIALAGAPIAVFVHFDDDLACYAAYNPPPGVYKHLLTPRHYYVRGINKAFDRLRAAGTDIFAVCNNDCEFTEPQWALQAKMTLFDSFEDGMGVVELGNTGGSLNAFVSRVPFYDANFDGQLFDPAYLQYYSDRERLLHLERSGRYIHYIPGFAFNHSVIDEVNADGRAFFDADQAMFYRRHPEELESDLARQESKTPAD